MKARIAANEIPIAKETTSARLRHAATHARYQLSLENKSVSGAGGRVSGVRPTANTPAEGEADSGVPPLGADEAAAREKRAIDSTVGAGLVVDAATSMFFSQTGGVTGGAFLAEKGSAVFKSTTPRDDLRGKRISVGKRVGLVRKTPRTVDTARAQAPSGALTARAQSGGMTPQPPSRPGTAPNRGARGSPRTRDGHMVIAPSDRLNKVPCGVHMDRMRGRPVEAQKDVAAIKRRERARVLAEAQRRLLERDLYGVVVVDRSDPLSTVRALDVIAKREGSSGNNIPNSSKSLDAVRPRSVRAVVAMDSMLGRSESRHTLEQFASLGERSATADIPMPLLLEGTVGSYRDVLSSHLRTDMTVEFNKQLSRDEHRCPIIERQGVVAHDALVPYMPNESLIRKRVPHVNFSSTTPRGDLAKPRDCRNDQFYDVNHDVVSKRMTPAIEFGMTVSRDRAFIAQDQRTGGGVARLRRAEQERDESGNRATEAHAYSTPNHTALSTHRRQPVVEFTKVAGRDIVTRHYADTHNPKLVDRFYDPKHHVVEKRTRGVAQFERMHGRDDEPQNRRLPETGCAPDTVYDVTAARAHVPALDLSKVTGRDGTRGATGADVDVWRRDRTMQPGPTDYSPNWDHALPSAPKYSCTVRRM